MNLSYPQNIDLDNPEFQNLWSLIQQTQQSVFLTGKAGTGKSTFLKYICAHTKKKFVVLAPTGIAAVNVGGQTLHSFFKIPFKPLLQNDPEYAPRMIEKTLRFSKDKIRLIKELDLIIIDEISMVRADIIDHIDRVLRHFTRNNREPFGGKQLLFVGDIFQLEPVVTRDMYEILRREYNRMFFFNARVFNQLGLIPIELVRVYRQEDGPFVALLDRVRAGKASNEDIAILNSRVNPNVTESDFTITLATRRDTVDVINDERLNNLKTPEITFQGAIDGDFPDNLLPTSLELTLKQGAQVIFIRNDKENRWVNGTIAKVAHIDTGKVIVEMEDGQQHTLEQEQWANVQYTYDVKKNVVVENVLGTFTQYPIKLAWALTVHKSQGLTFNNVIIDFQGGAFTGGQTYVALSRCTSLEGITMMRQLSQRDIIVNPAVIEFSRHFNNQQSINEALQQEQARVLYRNALQAFGQGQFRNAIARFAQAEAIAHQLQSPVVQRLIAAKLYQLAAQQRTIDALQEEIDAKNKLLSDLAAEYAQMGHLSLGHGILEEAETEYQPRTDRVAIQAAMANYDKALRICPTLTEAMVGKAELLLSLDRQQEAMELLKLATETDSKAYQAHFLLARLLAQDDLPEAIKCYKRAIKADKSRPEPHEALAEIYGTLDLDDLAEQHSNQARALRKAITSKPRRKSKK